jgi:phospholipid transport system substrate-binding protein
MKAVRCLVQATWIVAVLGFGRPAFGAESAPQAVIRKTVDDAFAVLKDQALSGKSHRAQRLAALRAIADRTFDWAEMARASVGATWRTLDAAKRARFVEVFKDVLAARYMDDIDKFEGTEKVTIDGSAPEGEDTVVRTTLITSSREHVPIDYRMRGSGERWNVIDISIEGVSLVNHYRKTFSAALVNMTIDQLLDHLSKQLPAASSK